MKFFKDLFVSMIIAAIGYIAAFTGMMLADKLLFRVYHGVKDLKEKIKNRKYTKIELNRD